MKKPHYNLEYIGWFIPAILVYWLIPLGLYMHIFINSWWFQLSWFIGYGWWYMLRWNGKKGGMFFVRIMLGGMILLVANIGILFFVTGRGMERVSYKREGCQKISVMISEAYVSEGGFFSIDWGGGDKFVKTKIPFYSIKYFSLPAEILNCQAQCELSDNFYDPDILQKCAANNMEYDPAWDEEIKAQKEAQEQEKMEIERQKRLESLPSREEIRRLYE